MTPKPEAIGVIREIRGYKSLLRKQETGEEPPKAAGVVHTPIELVRLRIRACGYFPNSLTGISKWAVFTTPLRWN
jgi:hypothetical protein